MFLVFRWNADAPLPPVRPRPALRALPPAPDRHRAALATIGALRKEGLATLAGIARVLNERRVPTLSGRGAWHGAQVARAEAKRPG